MTTESTAQPAPQPKSIIANRHMRVVITWLAIFPLVTLGFALLAPVSEDWNPVLRTLLLTAIVVPAAAYVVIPVLVWVLSRVERGIRRLMTRRT